MSENAKCRQCGFVADSSLFETCLSVYHDMRCSKCRTTDVDTSEINAAWKARGEVYGYGDDNCLVAEEGK